MTREEKEAMKGKAIHDAMCSIENRVRHVYNQGYSDGLADGNINSGHFADSIREAYNNGLEDAWECARKIFKSECATMKYIFHTAYYPEIILNNSPTEAIAKLKEYEEQQKQTEEKTDKSNLCADCETCRFADLTAYEFPCSVCSASHTFRWEARKGASE